MKKLSLKNKILTICAILLCAVILASLIHMIVTINNGTKTGSGEDLSSFDVVFSGTTHILDEDYDVVLKGKEGAFTLDANNLKGVMDGTYSFTDGQGWTFIFNDSLGLNVRSHYNNDKKQHELIYALDLGSRGAGNIQLVSEAKKFAAADSPWADIPTFTGLANLGVITAEMRLICKADNTFDFFSTNFGQYIPALTGTYVFADSTYTFNVGDEEYVAELNDGLYSVSLPVSLPVMGVSGIPAEMIQDVLVVE